MNSRETAPQRAAQAAGGKVPITLACALYDRMQALYTGDVKPEGIDLTFRVEDFPRRLFDSAMAEQQFDVCEMSSSDYITRVANGSCPFVAIPVFPSKMFRHGMIAINRRSGIRTAKDLEGRRVGVMRYTMTAAVWQRGHLQNDYGVDLSTIEWVEGAINSAGSHGVPTIIPPGVKLERNSSARSMSQLLAEGKVDATIGTHLPDSRFTSPDVVRLFPDFKEVEKAYYKRTGIFPIMHLIAIKRDVYERHPFIAQSLYRACQESKKAALTRMRNYSALRFMLPWLPSDLDELDEVFGADPWTYGIEEARTNIGTLMTYMVQQGMLKAAVPIEDLFIKVEE
jgi:4,5-dihydroxyphthalate decarboxylase